MDFKSKRISEITQIIIAMAMLLLYTRIGSIGTVYVAITLEIVFGLILLFFGSTTTNKLYCIISTILIEGLIVFIYHFVLVPSEIMFVGTFLKYFMFLIPLYAVLQWFKGILKVVFEPQISALSDLVFCIGTAIGTFLSCFVLGDYGKKAANLMQSIKLEYFYVILCIVPGFLFGCICAFIFLFLISRMQRKEVLICIRQQSANKQNKIRSYFQNFKDQIISNSIFLIQRIPVWLLLVLSIKEIKADNYLFGHLYGAILPLFCLIWNVFSISLICYKKRLVHFFKKRMYEQYYSDIKVVLSFAFIYGIFFLVCTFSLHKSYLAIWSLQTSSSFMGLMKASSLIAFLGFPYKVLVDIMNERKRTRECNFSIISGTILAVVVAAICHKFLGVGSVLYILCISFGMFVCVLLLSWFLWNDVGIEYLSILKRSYKAIVLHVFLCLILVLLENLIFTAFGGLGTLVICLLFSYIFLRLGLFFLQIFSKEERQLLSFKTNIKAILGITR